MTTYITVCCDSLLHLCAAMARKREMKDEKQRAGLEKEIQVTQMVAETQMLQYNFAMILQVQMSSPNLAKMMPESLS